MDGRAKRNGCSPSVATATICKMKPMRNFVLRLGDLAIPVGLVATARNADERLLRVLHVECKTPVTQRVYCALDERVLEQDETVTAWEVAPGQFLELDEKELDRLGPQDSSVVAITGFVDAGTIDPLLVKKRYHLAPSRAVAGRPAYRALAAAMHELDVVALTRFYAWNSEQLGAISSRGEILELATLHFLDDVALKQTDEIAEQLAEAPVSELVAELMLDVVARYTRTLKPDDLASEQRPRMRSLLEAKLNGQPIVNVDDETETDVVAPPTDLQTALRSTLKGAPRRRRAAAAR